MHTSSPLPFIAGIRLSGRRPVGLLLLTMLLAIVAAPIGALADPFPPYWQNGAGPAVHFQPAAWPESPVNPADCGSSCGEWRPYQAFSSSVNDPRIQDPSNGGTLPQNYVNIASSCSDQTLPSVYYAVDTANEVLFFRWRVEQIANSYAVGPSAGAYASTDPWKSAQWTVFFDLTGDGYRDLAAHLNGSSGDPANAIDRLVGVWGAIPNQSTDYINDPNIHLLAHNPTGFVDSGSSRILNFHSLNQPNALWQNGSAETLWDYGTTRATRINGGSCEEFFIDYQIPLDMLDATSFGGPKLTLTTPFSMLFCTANSLNNPMQKDCAYEGEWTAGPNNPAPFGDTVILQPPSPDPEPEPVMLPQPLVQTIAAQNCGPAQLSARIGDALYVNAGNNAISSLLDIDFYSYFDANANGLPDDAGSAWTLATAGSSTSPGVWKANWDSSSSPIGQLLIGLQAADQANLNPDAKANRTFSYYTDVSDIPGYPSTTENWYVNPSVDGITHWTSFTNDCGSPTASLTKSVSPDAVNIGETVDFTLTFNNTAAAPLTISRIEDKLPAGFSYVQAVSSDLSGAPALAPSPDDAGILVWTFSPAASIPAGSSATLIFRARVPTTIGVYANTASAVSSAGDLFSDPAQVTVGAPSLSLQLTSSPASVSPGEQIVYTLTYSNDTPVNLTNVVLTDVLPPGVTFVDASTGYQYDEDRTVTWNIGNLPAGSGPFTVTITVMAPTDIPTTPNPLDDSATIDSSETDPLTRTASTYLLFSNPVLDIQKEASTNEVAPGGTVIFTLRYANVGVGVAENAFVNDVVPAGFTYLDAQSTPACSLSAGTVSCPVGNLSSGATGTVEIAMQADATYTAANPQTNTAALTSGILTPATSSYTIGITQAGCTSTTYYLRGLPVSELPTPVGLPAIPQNQKFYANSSAPSTEAQIGPITVIQDAGEIEIAHFYLDPAQTTRQTFGALTQSFYITKSRSNPLSIAAYVYSYNSTTGVVSQIGSGFSSNNTGTYTNALFTFSVTPTAPLNPGDRLLWRITATNTNQDNELTLHINSDPAKYSRVTSCVSSANLSFDKIVDKTTAVAGNTLQYTLRFANAGNLAATSANIADTLPGNVTFVAATLNGVEADPQSIIGNVYTFQVNSSGAVAGTVAAGDSGVLVITARISDPLPPETSSLTNLAVFDAVEALPITDTAVTTIVQPVHPDVIITKSVNRTLLAPGDTTTYALVVSNNGTGPATNVTITDDLPDNTYYEYVPGSAKLDGVTLNPDPVSGGVLTRNIGALLAEQSTMLTFDMRALSGLPAGITQETNQATVSNTETPGERSSNTVAVSLNANPILRLHKTVSPGSGNDAGDELTYTLTVENIGGGPAEDVLILDAIPGHTTYVTGSLVAASLSQTDARDADAAEYDQGAQRVSFHAASLAAGGSYAVQFRVRVRAILPATTNLITNEASVSAANAATQTAAVTTNASALPELGLTKTGPTSVAYPAAHLAVAASSGVTTVTLDNASQLVAGQYVRINAIIARITAIDGVTVSLDTPVTGAPGDNVLSSATYTLRYENNGATTATAVTLQDTLPLGMVFVSATAGGVNASGTVTWSLPDLAPGAGGSVQLTVIPTSSGAYTNEAHLDCDETAPVDASHNLMAAGGLTVVKAATDSSLERTANGVEAEWTITVQNTSASAATNVRVTDRLPQGFSYVRTVAANGARTAIVNPTAGDQQPVWGAWTIPAGGSLTITFRAAANSSIAPGTYLNDVLVTSDTVDYFPYDPLLQPEGEVSVNVQGLEGMVWRDDNNNAHIDPVEWPLQNVTITVYNASNQTVATLRSGLAGGFQLDGLAVGSYRLVVTPPSGATHTTPLSVTVVVPESGVGYANFGFLAPTAVTMSTPRAQVIPGRASITWSTQLEMGLRGFNVYRAASLTGERWQVNAVMIPARCSGVLAPCDYTVEDPTALPGATYYYWVEAVDADISIWSDPLEVIPLYGLYLPALLHP